MTIRVNTSSRFRFGVFSVTNASPPRGLHVKSEAAPDTATKRSLFWFKVGKNKSVFTGRPRWVRSSLEKMKRSCRSERISFYDQLKQCTPRFTDSGFVMEW
jgi:hypothetical protein